MLALVQGAGRARADARVGVARRLDEEWDNVREALRWCVASGEVDVGARLLWALTFFAFERGAVPETGMWAERLLALPVAAAATWSRARLLFVAGQGALGVSDRARRYAHYEQAVAVSRQVGDTACLAEGLRALGYEHASGGRVDAAAPLVEESLALHRAHGNQRGVVLALHVLAEAAVRRGDLAATRSLHEEALRVARALGDPHLIANCLSGHSLVAELAEDFPTARRFIEDSLRLRRAGVENGATINSRVRWARIWLQEGEPAEAEPLLAESLGLIRRLGLPEDLDQALHHLARVAWLRQDPARAAHLLGAAEAEQERTGTRAPGFALGGIAQLMAAVRAALGEVEYDAAYAEGRALSRDAAIAFALEPTTTTGGGA
jgi:hypothetical protein